MTTAPRRPAARPVVAIHGGAATPGRGELTAATQAACRDALDHVLANAQALLARGAPALDVVTEAVRLLQDRPLFNARFGAVYTAAGSRALDACVMRGVRAAGARQRAGA